MSSVLSSWFYILVLGIAALLLVMLVFIFFNPSFFLQLTSASGQLVDLTGVNDFNPLTNATIAATAQSAVIKVGANSYSVANNTVPSGIPNAFVIPGTFGIDAADDVAGAKITGTFMFWLLMLAIGFLSLLLAFIAVKYPEKLFGPQISALVGCLPKTKSPCSSSSSCPTPQPVSTPTVLATSQQPVTNNSVLSANSSPVQAMAALRQAAAVSAPTASIPVTPIPKSTTTNTTAGSPAGFTAAQLAVLQQIMAGMATKSQTTPTV